MADTSADFQDPDYEDYTQRGLLPQPRPQPAVIAPPQPRADSNTPSALPSASAVADTVASDGNETANRLVLPRAGRASADSVLADASAGALPGETYDEAINRRQTGVETGVLPSIRSRYVDPSVEAAAHQRDLATTASAAEQTARDTNEQQKEWERQQAQAQQAQVAHWKDQGMVLQHTPEGDVRPQTRADGSLVYTPKSHEPFQWKTEEGGDGAWYQDHRNDRGEMVRQNLQESGQYHTDALTGERYITLTGGARQNIGVDDNVVKVHQLREQQDALALQEAQDTALLQQRKMALRPLQEQLTAARKVLNPDKAERDFAAAQANYAPGGAMADPDLWNAAQKAHATFLAKWGPLQQQVDQHKAEIEALETKRANNALARANGLADIRTAQRARYDRNGTNATNGTDGTAIAEEGTPQAVAQAVQTKTIAPVKANEVIRQETDKAEQAVKADNGVGAVKDFAVRWLAGVSSAVNKSVAGIDRFLGAHGVPGAAYAADYWRERADTSDYLKRTETNPARDTSVAGVIGDTAGSLTAMAPGMLAGAVAAPAVVAALGGGAASTGAAGLAIKIAPKLAGAAGMGLQMAGEAGEAAYQKHLAEKPEDTQGATTAMHGAMLRTLPQLAAFEATGFVGGKIIGSATGVLPILEVPWARAIVSGGVNMAGNTVAGAAGRAIEGENPLAETPQGVAQNLAFSLMHAHAEYGAAKYAPTAKAIADGTHPEIVLNKGISEDNAQPQEVRDQAAKQVDALQKGAGEWLKAFGAKDSGTPQKDTYSGLLDLHSKLADAVASPEGLEQHNQERKAQGQKPLTQEQAAGLVRAVGDQLHAQAQAVIGADPAAAGTALQALGSRFSPDRVLGEISENPLLARVALVVGNEGRGLVAPEALKAAGDALGGGDAPAKQQRARLDQLVGAHLMLEHLGTAATTGQMDANAGAFFERLGLVRRTEAEDGTARWRLTEDGIPFLQKGLREAVGKDPSRFNVDVAHSGEPGTVARGLDEAGVRREAEAVQSDTGEQPRFHVRVQHGDEAGGDVKETWSYVQAPDEAHAQHVAERTVRESGQTVIESEAVTEPKASEKESSVQVSEAQAQGLFHDVLKGYAADLRKLGIKAVNRLDKEHSDMQRSAGVLIKGDRLAVSFAKLADSLSVKLEKGESPRSLMEAMIHEEFTHAAALEALHTEAAQEHAGASAEEIQNAAKAKAEEISQTATKGMVRAMRRLYPGWDALNHFQKGHEMLAAVLTGKYRGTVTSAVYKAVQKIVRYMVGRVETLPETSPLRKAVAAVEARSRELQVELGARQKIALDVSSGSEHADGNGRSVTEQPGAFSVQDRSAGARGVVDEGATGRDGKNGAPDGVHADDRGQRVSGEPAEAGQNRAELGNEISLKGEAVPLAGEWKAKNPDGPEVFSGKWALAPLDGPTVNAQFGEGQDRIDRERTGAAQRLSIIQHFNADNVGLAWAESPSLSDGAPTMTADGSVLAGNNRLMSLRDMMAAHPEKAKIYQDWVRQKAAELGLDAQAMGNRPVALVRVVDGDLGGMDKSKFVQSNNTPGTERRSVAEVALQDRKVLADTAGTEKLDPLEDGSFNKDFLHAFYDALGSPKELRKENGSPDPEKIEKRAQAALLSHLLGNAPGSDRVLANLMDNMGKPGVRQAVAGLSKAGTALLHVEAINPELNILPHVGRAVSELLEYRRAKAAGEVRDVAEFKAQGNLFASEKAEGEGLSAKVLELLAGAKSAKAVWDPFLRYAKAVEEYGDPKQDRLFPMEKPDAGNFLAAADPPARRGESERLWDIAQSEPESDKPLTAAETAKWSKLYRKLTEIERENGGLLPTQRAAMEKAERALGQGMMFGGEMASGAKRASAAEYGARWDSGPLRGGGLNEQHGLFDERGESGVGRFEADKRQGVLFAADPRKTSGPEFEKRAQDWKASLRTESRPAHTFQDAARQAQAFVGESVINEDTGISGVVSRRNLGKMLSASAALKSTNAEDHALAIANADRLFRTAAVDRSHSDARNEPTIEAIHRFVAPLKTESGNVVAVKMTVKETTHAEQPNPIYSIETLEIVKPGLDAPQSGIERAPEVNRNAPQPGFTPRVRALLDVVNPESKMGESPLGAADPRQKGLDFGTRGLELFDRLPEKDRERVAELHPVQGDLFGEQGARAESKGSAIELRGQVRSPLLPSGQFGNEGREGREAKPGVITDIGEKIGGARKDLAEKPGPKATKAVAAESEEPGWQKRFVATEQPNGEGWSLWDSKTKRPVRDSESWKPKNFASKEAAEAAIPLHAVALKHQVEMNSRSPGEDATYSIWRKVTDNKRVRVVAEDFKTRDEALRYMAQHAVQIIETKTRFGEEVLARPEKVMRQGAERRTGPATPEMFGKAFGFRGVEFGNWNNQGERQEVLNHAYDGLHDLAETLGIPASAISLNGELALAFGARGHGLSGAVAHYERNYGVINLTKMSGAGSLAHEWLHAVDHYLGRQDGKASSEKVRNDRGDLVFDAGSRRADYASHGFRGINSGVRPEVREAYRDLVDSMFTKAHKYVEDTQKAEQFVGHQRDQLKASLDRIREGLAAQLNPEWYKRNNKPASAEQLARFDTLAAKLVAGEDLATEYRANKPGDTEARRRGAMTGRWSNDTLDGISEIMKAVRGRAGWDATNHNGPLDYLRGNMSNYAARMKMLADAEAGSEKTKRVPTSYAMENKKIDQGAVTDYWTTPHEMAARAFSAYIEDKIAEGGHRSDFLSYGSDNKFYRMFDIRPFPEGEERRMLDDKFDAFFKTLKTKETEKGTALYAAEPEQKGGEKNGTDERNRQSEGKGGGREAANEAATAPEGGRGTTANGEGQRSGGDSTGGDGGHGRGHGRSGNVEDTRQVQLLKKAVATLEAIPERKPSQEALLTKARNELARIQGSPEIDKAGDWRKLFSDEVRSTESRRATKAGQVVLRTVRSRDSGVQIPEGIAREISASIHGVGIGAKPLYHDHYGSDLSGAIADVLRQHRPPGVVVHEENGHVYAYSENAVRAVIDRDPQAYPGATLLDKIRGAVERDHVGDLLGYGVPTREKGNTLVLIRDSSGKFAFGFRTSQAKAEDRGAMFAKVWSDIHGEAHDFVVMGDKPKNEQLPMSSGDSPLAAAPVEAAAHEAATSPKNDRPEPSEPQKEAGNYRMGHIRVGGMDISVENPEGSKRSGVDKDGKPWETEMKAHYGYIRGTEGKDGDHVDVFVKPGTPEDFSGSVYVVNQVDPLTGKFDEHKAVIGAGSREEAQKVYESNYGKGWKGLGSMVEMPLERFKEWAAEKANTKKEAMELPGHRRSQMEFGNEEGEKADTLSAAVVSPKRQVARLEGLLKANREGKGRQEMEVGDGVASPEVEARAKKDSITSAETRMAEALGVKKNGTEGTDGTDGGKEAAAKNAKLAKELEALEPKVSKLDGVKERARGFSEWVKRLWEENTQLPAEDPYKRAVNRYTAKLQASELNVMEMTKHILDKVPDALTREGITNWRVAQGDENKLRLWAEMSADPKLKAGYEAALRLTPEQKEIASTIDAYYKDKLALGQDRGMLEHGVENYASQIWRDDKGKKIDMDGVPSAADYELDSKGERMRDADGNFILKLGKKFNQGFAFANARQFEDYFTGESQGFRPLTKDCASLLGIYGSEFNRTLALREFVKELTEVKAADGRPIVGVGVSQILRPVKEGEPVDQHGAFHIEKPENSQGFKNVNHPVFERWKYTMPVQKGEEAMELPGQGGSQMEFGNQDASGWNEAMGDPAAEKGKTVAMLRAGNLLVHPDFEKKFNNLVGESGIRNWYHSKGSAMMEIPKAIVRAIDWGNKEMKGLTFVGSPFHLIHLDKRAAGYQINPFTDLHPIDTENPLHRRALLAGLMIAPDKNGIGRWLEGLGGADSSFAAKIPVAKEMAHYCFESFIPRLKMKAWTTLTERMVAKFKPELESGKMSVYQVENYAARITNNAFGHLNYAEMGRNPTLQHIIGLATLAPDFSESTLRHLGDAARGLNPASKVGRESFKSIMVLAAGTMFIAKTLNKLIDGEWHLDHPFSVVVGNREYSVRSQVADLQHMYRDWRGYLMARMSPVSKTLWQVGTQKNYRGESMGWTDQARDFIASWIPATLRALPGMNQISPTDAVKNLKWYEQFTASMGMKVARYSATREVNQLADKFLQAKGRASMQGAYTPSRFTALKNSLDDGDVEGAKAAYKQLATAALDEAKRKAKGGVAVRNPISALQNGFYSSVFHPIIQDQALNAEFVRGLTTHQRELYQKSLQERNSIWMRFQKISGADKMPPIPSLPSPVSAAVSRTIPGAERPMQPMARRRVAGEPSMA